MRRQPRGTSTGGQFAPSQNPEPNVELGVVRNGLHLNEKTAAALDTIITDITGRGGKVLVVGGSVRDMLLNLPAHDLDLEISGLDMDTIHAAVANKFSLDTTGASFSVLKVRVPDSNDIIDVAIPRTEELSGEGHRDFRVTSDPTLDFATAASRRDFTINAMGFDPTTGVLLDCFGGEDDLRDGAIRHVSDKFSEDPLRPLRAARFAGRFGFSIAPETVELCRAMRPLADHLPSERVWGELVGILESDFPGHSLHALDQIGWIDVFPEVAALRGVEQDARWHPEGDTFVHTAHVLNYAAANLAFDNEHDKLVVMAAALCHDLGKSTTTEFRDGRLRSHGHEGAGVPLTNSFLHRLGQVSLAKDVAPLVEHHLAPVTLTTDRAIRRLSTKVPRLDLLAAVSRADAGGRPPLTNTEASKKIDEFSNRVQRLNLNDGPPKPWATGDHLIKLGLTPGPRFRELLGTVYDAQLDGVVSNETEAVEMLRGLV